MSEIENDVTASPVTISIVIHAPPFSTIAGKEGVDLALVCAAFEQKVNLIFIDSGVLHLSRSQNADAIGDKLHDKQLGALEFYDIDQIYCESSALSAYGMKAEELIDNCQIVNSKAIRELLETSNYTVTF